MASILIIGDDAPIPSWVETLRDEHQVETLTSVVDLPPGKSVTDHSVDIIIVVVSNPDTGDAMPIANARSLWPGCKVIAVTSGYTFRTSAFFRMGLWSPDQLLLKPVNLRILRATVNFLWAQVRTEQIREIVASSSKSGETFKHPGMSEVQMPRQLLYD